MTLKYNILWFDDSQEFIDSLAPMIKEYLENLGFVLNLKRNPEENRLKEIFETERPDLLLVDFDLKKSETADKLLETISRDELYAAAILYSQHTDFQEKIGGKLQGVWFTERKNLREKTRKIIDLTIKKQQDVNNMRGVIIAETIYLEQKMDTFVKTYLGIDDERKNITEKILDPEFGALDVKKKYDLINKICKEKIKTLERLQEKSDAEKKELIQAAKTSLITRKTEFIKVYDEIIKIRNVMAHAKEDENKKNTLISYIIENEPICINDEWCGKTRKSIKKHSENLDGLINDFQKLGGT